MSAARNVPQKFEEHRHLLTSQPENKLDSPAPHDRVVIHAVFESLQLPPDTERKPGMRAGKAVSLQRKQVVPVRIAADHPQWNRLPLRSTRIKFYYQAHVEHPEVEADLTYHRDSSGKFYAMLRFTHPFIWCGMYPKHGGQGYHIWGSTDDQLVEIHVHGKGDLHFRKLNDEELSSAPNVPVITFRPALDADQVSQLTTSSGNSQSPDSHESSQWEISGSDENLCFPGVPSESTGEIAFDEEEFRPAPAAAQQYINPQVLQNNGVSGMPSVMLPAAVESGEQQHVSPVPEDAALLRSKSMKHGPGDSPNRAEQSSTSFVTAGATTNEPASSGADRAWSWGKTDPRDSSSNANLRLGEEWIYEVMRAIVAFILVILILLVGGLTKDHIEHYFKTYGQGGDKKHTLSPPYLLRGLDEQVSLCVKLGYSIDYINERVTEELARHSQLDHFPYRFDYGVFRNIFE